MTREPLVWLTFYFEIINKSEGEASKDEIKTTLCAMNENKGGYGRRLWRANETFQI